ncbi:hypothetical protein NF867_04310 [Solitalea sp. MAHUQ-68]|uniref:Uncharacterized protein n=1 Tax=Solitalea agri TaxID=2953739 RepID=A0A9X2F0W9_9SPHI|nr:hypothetical protein [Solitalea agri]MCO4292084.1 hypothetical protein [Solitalea agri]
MKKKLLALALIIFSLSSCSDKWEYTDGMAPETGNNGGNDNGNGDGDGDGNVNQPVYDYQPMTTGSKWVYTGDFNYIIEATNEEMVIDGITYHSFTNSYMGNKFFSAKKDGAYYTYGNASAEATQLDFPATPMLYLKDNASVNSSWSSKIKISPEGSPVDLFAQYAYTVKEKGISFKVDKATYTDVIRIDMTMTLPGSSTPISKGSYYYAKKIGFIYSKITMNGETNTVKLASYEIKP